MPNVYLWYTILLLFIFFQFFFSCFLVCLFVCCLFLFLAFSFLKFCLLLLLLLLYDILQGFKTIIHFLRCPFFCYFKNIFGYLWPRIEVYSLTFRAYEFEVVWAWHGFEQEVVICIHDNTIVVGFKAWFPRSPVCILRAACVPPYKRA